MTTTVISFEHSLNSSETKKIIAVLKALGVNKIVVEEKQDPLTQLIEEGRKDLKDGKAVDVSHLNYF